MTIGIEESQQRAPDTGAALELDQLHHPAADVN
jgi:hypothetical protein